MNVEKMKLKITNKYRVISVRKIAPICALLALVLGGNGQAFGFCYFGQLGITLPMYLTLPANLPIQRDTPAGTVIWTSNQSTSTRGTILACIPPYTESTYYLTATRLAIGYTDVYQTVIPGIGFRVRNQGNFSRWNAVPSSTTYTSSDGGRWNYTENNYIFFKIELIYVGGDVNGKLTLPSPLATLTTGSITAGQLYVNGSTTITKSACSLNSTSINVPLGDVAATKFTGIASTAGDTGFNVGLTCDRSAKISVSLTGSQNTDTPDTSVLALTGAGLSGTASGVGVQLLYGTAPLKINNKILLKTSIVGQETLPFSARYYQTQTAIGGGLANSSATLNITYQ
ncbi:fimbrial protein [Serratia quinivorans]|uniref:fimbrial protein n=1 Tax=Serratia quinivorans TaxID=137545 RepID=UPI0021793EB7|nr:fimbrial protein [Serratia quinivorans]CAI1690817.1 Fimbrial subunit type 1 precursor [Serratia quinivorans]CAI1772757.1 Fimbrial subunit type 1 precursor [Serratia quinivorans]